MKNNALTKPQAAEMSYPERAARENLQAVIAHAQRAGDKWLAAKEKSKQGSDLLLSAVNDIRAAGLALIAASGHEQLVFHRFGIQFFAHLKPHLPAGMDLRQGELCVAIAQKLPAEIHDLKSPDAKAALQMILIADHTIEPAKRLGGEQAHEKNPWNDWTDVFARAETVYAELEKENGPMHTWDRPKVETARRETEKFAQINARARTILGMEAGHR